MIDEETTERLALAARGARPPETQREERGAQVPRPNGKRKNCYWLSQEAFEIIATWSARLPASQAGVIEQALREFDASMRRRRR